ncbi:MAG: hypothetical protein QXG02_04315 [Candidatus Anstonellales archaeon]
MQLKTIEQAQREKEVLNALTLSDAEKQILKSQVEWKLQGIEVVVQRALYEKVAPLLVRIWNEVDKHDEEIQKIKKKRR